MRVGKVGHLQLYPSCELIAFNKICFLTPLARAHWVVVSKLTPMSIRSRVLKPTSHAKPTPINTSQLLTLYYLELFPMV